MSYVRWSSHSDAYVYEGTDNLWWLHITDGRTETFLTPGGCSERLEELKAEGLKIPQGAIDALRDEQELMTGAADSDSRHSQA